MNKLERFKELNKDNKDVLFYIRDMEFDSPEHIGSRETFRGYIEYMYDESNGLSPQAQKYIDYDKVFDDYRIDYTAYTYYEIVEMLEDEMKSENNKKREELESMSVEELIVEILNNNIYTERLETEIEKLTKIVKEKN